MFNKMTLDGGDEPGKLFVGGLSWETTVDKLNEYFCRYGEVTDCVVMKNPETGRSRGFGFVTYKDPSCVEMVIANGPHSLDGRTIDPKECNPKSAQKGKREAKVGNFPKVFLGGLPPNVNESVLREFFSKYGKVIEVVIMYDQEKKKTRGFGFLSFDSEETIDKVVADHFVNINGKQVEVKRAEPRDKQGMKMTGHMASNQMQSHSGQMAGPMLPWNPMWGPQAGPPMHAPIPPGQTIPPQAGGPMHGVPNGMMTTGYPPTACWNPSQQGAYSAGSNGWAQTQGYQGWPGYGYQPQGWGAHGYAYGSTMYSTSYPNYGQSTGVNAVSNTQTPAAQTAIAGNASSTSNSAGQYIANPQQAQPVVPTQVAAGNATVTGNYPQEASTFGPSRVGNYTTNPNYAYPLQGQGDASTASASTYNSSASVNPPFNRTTSQTQGYHPYRRV